MGFIEDLEKESNKTITENGDVAFETSNSAVLDLFALGGAVRKLSADERLRMFENAYRENSLLAVRCMFYLRSPRDGQGERNIFREFLEFVIRKDITVFNSFFKFVPELGRWDDLFYLINCVPDYMIETMYRFIFEIMNMDFMNAREGKPITLLAKWLPSINASNKERRKKAFNIINRLKVKKGEYRAGVSDLREYLKVTETFMSAKEWGRIEYKKVPSKAMLKYQKAFSRNDKERYSSYLSNVLSGKERMNMKVTYPHEILGLFFEKDDDYRAYMSQKDFIEASWKSLPNYANSEENALVVADTSGSMSGTPLKVCIALAMYFAERNKGYFKNRFITFSAKPALQKIQGDNLYEKVMGLSNAHWDANTDLRAVFELILKTACEHGTKVNEMPKRIYILSDMQFDEGVTTLNESTYESIKRRYKHAGYEIPEVIFWNLRAENIQVPVTKDEMGTVLVSGYSPITFKYITDNVITTPYEFMLSVLNSEPFNKIEIK